LKLIHFLKALLLDERGQDLVEYALLVALIAMVAVAGEKSFASDLSSAFSKIGTTISSDV
jgi:pilus assembly protein Flp/PilA